MPRTSSTYPYVPECGAVYPDAIYTPDRVRVQLCLDQTEFRQLCRAGLPNVGRGKRVFYLGKHVIAWFSCTWVNPEEQRRRSERKSAEAILSLSENGIRFKDGNELVAKYFPKKAAAFEKAHEEREARQQQSTT